MSIERFCKECGFMEDYRLNFGDEREAERIWHESNILVKSDSYSNNSCNDVFISLIDLIIYKHIHNNLMVF